MNWKTFLIFFTAAFAIVIFPIKKVNLKEGMKAPNFSLLDQNGKKIKLSSYNGKSVVVLYFYPKAGTAGCTKQACGIRDDINLFEQNNITVLGISTDTRNEIKRFVKENNLNFPLLSDASKEVTAKYGVLREDGKAKRVTFIIDKKGVIVNILQVTDVLKHAEDVFKIASKL